MKRSIKIFTYSVSSLFVLATVLYFFRFQRAKNNAIKEDLSPSLSIESGINSSAIPQSNNVQTVSKTSDISPSEGIKKGSVDIEPVIPNDNNSLVSKNIDQVDIFSKDKVLGKCNNANCFLLASFLLQDLEEDLKKGSDFKNNLYALSKCEDCLEKIKSAIIGIAYSKILTEDEIVTLYKKLFYDLEKNEFFSQNKGFRKRLSFMLRRYFGVKEVDYLSYNINSKANHAYKLVVNKKYIECLELLNTFKIKNNADYDNFIVELQHFIEMKQLLSDIHNAIKNELLLCLL